jgi:hypothetical protein
MVLILDRRPERLERKNGWRTARITTNIRAGGASSSPVSSS